MKRKVGKSIGKRRKSRRKLKDVMKRNERTKDPRLTIKRKLKEAMEKLIEQIE